MPEGYRGGPTLVEARAIGVTLGGKPVLENVSAEVHAGEVISLIGPNGSGKTTLVRVLLGLVTPDRGTVVRRPGLRIGYVPQRLVLDPTLPITTGRFLALTHAGAAAPGRERLAQILAEVGAGDIGDHPLHEISGGELQRVLLARALLRDPELLVLDEPAQGLDIHGRGELYRRIAQIREQRGCGMLIVSHELHLVMAATDRVLCINHHVCCVDTPEAVARDPSFIALFGEPQSLGLAVYHHAHDHAHDLHGGVVHPKHPDSPPHRHG